MIRGLYSFGERALRLARLQINHYYRTQFLRTRNGGGPPAWYETQRKTTHVIFWS